MPYRALYGGSHELLGTASLQTYGKIGCLRASLDHTDGYTLSFDIVLTNLARIDMELGKQQLSSVLK